MITILKLNIISVTSRTISCEIENEEYFYTRNKMNLYLDGEKTDEIGRNVFTMRNLKPGSEYAIYIEDSCTKDTSEEIRIKTKNETAVLNVKDFGAMGDGKSIDSQSITAAIAACPDDGRVYFPKGNYLTGPIFLRSNITLEFEKDSVLIGLREREKYPILPGMIKSNVQGNEYYLASFEGEAADIFASLITGINVRNVNIIGEGTLDGNAGFDTWWHEPKIKKTAWRPRTVFLNGCENILIEGITVKNSPSWTLHPLLSRNLKFVNLNIENPKDAPNTDGLNPESCKNVQILGIRFSVGDDCIAIKSGKFTTSRKYPIPSEELYIRNCLMEYGHGAVVVGSEMSGGVKNVYVEKCIFNSTDRGIRIKTRRGRGSTGIIDEIHASKIKMNKVLTPFTINCFYFCDADGKTEYVWSKEKIQVDERTPCVGNIYLSNIVCTDAQIAAGFMYGLPERKIEKVVMENIKIHFAANSEPGYAEMLSFAEPMCKNGFYFNNIKKLKLKNVNVINAAKAFIRLNIDEEEIL